MVAGTLLVSCHASTEPLVPDAFLAGQAAAAGLQFSVDVFPTSFYLGQSATMTIHLKNPRATTARITFSSGCEVLPFISAGHATLVYPPGGGWACTQSQTVLQIGANSEYTRGITILGGPPSQTPFSGAAISPGTYVAYAELGDGMGRSNGVRFMVLK